MGDKKLTRDDKLRIKTVVTFMKNFMKYETRAYEMSGMSTGFINSNLNRYKMYYLEHHKELYDNFITFRKEVTNRNRTRGIMLVNETRKDVITNIFKKKSNNNKKNIIISEMVNRKIKNIEYTEFIDLCIEIYPECEDSVNKLFKLARKSGITVFDTKGKILN